MKYSSWLLRCRPWDQLKKLTTWRLNISSLKRWRRKIGPMTLILIGALIIKKRCLLLKKVKRKSIYLLKSQPKRKNRSKNLQKILQDRKKRNKKWENRTNRSFSMTYTRSTSLLKRKKRKMSQKRRRLQRKNILHKNNSPNKRSQHQRLDH